ncbi:hypothetical protein AXG93_2016s1510 [Marchantia polymorpha subsp. ruderalis]|uniref:Uncharacterized protein n=1 Tax=Marchantia polymorpha subsp. ruderalis TaxID=1480154 RepID=A0A176VXX1_MARPO|nr:hypothetical protein AXG93_2016s1510 [Marchantia polymorpha subsp. ruderalis]
MDRRQTLKELAPAVGLGAGPVDEDAIRRPFAPDLAQCVRRTRKLSSLSESSSSSLLCAFAREDYEGENRGHGECRGGGDEAVRECAMMPAEEGGEGGKTWRDRGGSGGRAWKKDEDEEASTARVDGRVV